MSKFVNISNNLKLQTLRKQSYASKYKAKNIPTLHAAMDF